MSIRIPSTSLNAILVSVASQRIYHSRYYFLARSVIVLHGSERRSRMCSSFYCFRGTDSVAKHFPMRGSQNLTRLSLPPEQINPLVGCHLTHLTSHPCPAKKNGCDINGEGQQCHQKVWTHRQRNKMQKIHCGPVKLLSSLRSSNPQSLITPSSPQLANLLSLGEKLISRMLSL